MAEKLESYEFMRGGTRTTHYDKFLDGSIWRLRLGVDVPSKRFIGARAALLRQAAKKGLKLHASALEEGFIVVQAYNTATDGRQ